MTEKLENLVEQWLRWDQWDATRGEIQDMKLNNDLEELERRLANRMEFGTAGLRAEMGAGNSRMNDLTVIQATQGLLVYMQREFDEIQLRKGGIVVGFDGRHNSARWARRVAAVFSNAGVKVHLFSAMTPTPFVPFTISKFHCLGGVMVTASHNPKEDNGYKVYWSNGCQIIPPHDHGIATMIERNLEPWATSWNLELGDLVVDPLRSVMDSYFLDTRNAIGCRDNDANAASRVKIVHSSMHGVAHPFLTAIFKSFHLPDFYPVEEQKEADPEFTTVKFPNPEEGASALDLAIQTANRHDCDLILANDPDADRMAVAERKMDGGWRLFTGNETAALIGWWLLRRWRRNHGQTGDMSDCYMISSTVSSFILKSMALKEGFRFVDTLTGFKWMGNKTHDLVKMGKEVLFAFEEAIGFMCSSSVLDKDGVSACALVGELAAHIAEEGLTLSDKLENIFSEYGYHLSTSSYFISRDPSQTKAMFDAIRQFGRNDDNKYPRQCGPYRIERVRDLTTGYDDGQPDLIPLLPCSKTSQMITFYFENGGRVTLRTSGTEPKIKYYAEIVGAPGIELKEIQTEFDGLIDHVIREWYRPEVRGFEWRKG